MRGMQKQLCIWVSICGILGFFVVGSAQEALSQTPRVSHQIVAQAPEDPERTGAPPPGNVPGVNIGDSQINWSKVGLSQEQKTQFIAKRREFQIETAAVREELRFVEQDLRAEIAKDPVDRASIDALLEKIRSLKQQLSESAVQNLLDLKGLLTPEQVAKLAEFQMRIPKELQALQLTAEQRKQAWQIIKTSMQRNRQASEQLFQLRAELQDLLFSSEVDRARITEVQQAITEQEMILETSRIDVLLQMREVLTPEQRERYHKIRNRQQPERDSPPARRDNKKR